MKKDNNDYQNVRNVQAMQKDTLSKMKIEKNDNVDDYIFSLANIQEFDEEDSKLIEAYFSNDNIKQITIPSFDNLSERALQKGFKDTLITDLLTESKIKEIDERIDFLEKEYKKIYYLDEMDYAIAISGGIITALIDMVLVGLPENTTNSKIGPINDWVNKKFDELIPEEHIKKLEKMAKVPFDVRYNADWDRNDLEGLSPQMHRFYSLGHDPSLLGFIVGVIDIMRGAVSIIDKNGKIVLFHPRRSGEVSLLTAISKEFLHLLSDVNTEMSLPAPLMTLANLLQFGSIGDQEQTIAEIVQSMYHEGYDFKYFVSQSIGVLIGEIIVKFSYSLKMIANGNSLKDLLPIVDRDKNPKLESILFVSSLVAVAINSGKIIISKDPLSFNYPQWLFFVKHFIAEFHWMAIKEPKIWDEKFVKQAQKNMDDIRERVKMVLENSSDKYEIIFEE